MVLTPHSCVWRSWEGWAVVTGATNASIKAELGHKAATQFVEKDARQLSTGWFPTVCNRQEQTGGVSVHPWVV